MSDNTTIDRTMTETAPASFFRKLDWSAFWTACAISFAVYFYTLAPSVTLEDSGELAVAGDALGVPHPPGYPSWTILAWLFARVFSFVTFRGQPNPAWSIGLLSAVFGALATGVTAMLICRSGSDLLREARETLHRASHAAEDVFCWVGGVSTSLLFAFSPVMWSQSVIIEVYALNAFLLVMVFLLSYRWMCRPTNGVLYMTAFIFGLGLTNYQVLLLAAVPLAIIIMLKDVRLFRDFVIVGLPLGIMLIARGGLLNSLSEAANPKNLDVTICSIYIALNVAILVLAYFFLPHGKTVALTFLAAELGLAFYLYMPIVSDLRNPPMNWGYPRTWEGFKHAITRGQYEKIQAADKFKPAWIFSRNFFEQLGVYVEDLRIQYALIAAPLGLLPFTVWSFRAFGKRIRIFYAAVALTVLGVSVAMLEKFVFAGNGAFLALYKLAFLMVAALMAGGIVGVFLNQVHELVERFRDKEGVSLADRCMTLLILLGGAAAFALYVIVLIGRIVEVTQLLRAPKGPIPPDRPMQVLIACIVFLGLIILPTLLIGFIGWLKLKPKRDFKFAIDRTSQQWMIATLFGFGVMSLLLVLLCSPKGDIQDTFIQKVKFISSHALFAFWIGYGMIFALALTDTIFRGNRTLRWIAVAAAMLLPIFPIHQNYCNDELVRKYGGAEQNGHDYGWQFGNYQLRGAEAISEELESDEEPLPNPDYPPEMGPNAIFYGGTDPGRFVPTYMIFGAKVREDVFLITQNALADGTYMSVMRDLYGDDIWIPAVTDSAIAFRRYVQEVESGVRKPNAALKIENGRVQVSGALGVMEINGILAQMIFEHNKPKHDFFVEESYVIQWMYPYLEPHGLIMKINKNPIKITDSMIKNDMDFWDWYLRHLTADMAFMRDIAARKSFSKLRSAIAGLYANRGRFNEAERAFQHSRQIYPLSPEANIRLAQEVYMRLSRFDEAKEVLQDFQRRDPGNKRVPSFLQFLDVAKQRVTKIRELESTRPLQLNKAFELAKLYRDIGNMPKFRDLTARLVSNTTFPAEVYFGVARLQAGAKQYKEMQVSLAAFQKRSKSAQKPETYLEMAQMYHVARNLPKMHDMLRTYVKMKPTDWRARLDLTSVQLSMGKVEEAVVTLEQAMRLGGAEAMELIRKNGTFNSIRDRAARRAKTSMTLPMPIR